MYFILICALLQSGLQEKNIFNSMVENALNLKHTNLLVNFFFFFSFGVLQLMLTKGPQPNGSTIPVLDFQLPPPVPRCHAA
jgi:hypothetical protein